MRHGGRYDGYVSATQQVEGGQKGKVRILLKHAAPTPGLKVTLHSSNPVILPSVPNSITVPAGYFTSPARNFTTKTVSVEEDVTISATYPGMVFEPCMVTVGPPGIQKGGVVFMSPM